MPLGISCLHVVLHCWDYVCFGELSSLIHTKHTSVIKHADNNPMSLTNQYSNLFLKIASLINTFILSHCSFYYFSVTLLCI